MVPNSLKARITLLTSCLAGLLWLAAAAATWMEARHEAEELFDAHLVQAASLLIAQTGMELEHDGEHGEDAFDDAHAPLLHRYGRRVAFQVWIDGRLRLHSANAPSRPLSASPEGLSESVVDGEGWRVFSARNERRGALVQVGERLAARDELARAVAAGLLRPLLVALPVLALLIWLAVRQGVRPIERVAGEIGARSPDKLSPLPTAGLPDEVMPLAERLNALFARVAQTFDQERRFTADAAHELRTPLAGLKAQAQVALGATDDTVRRRALDNLVRGCDRMAHTVEQLLVLARVEASRPGDFMAADLAAIAREVVGGLADAALGREVEIEVVGTEAAPLAGNPAWLAILVRNLADNAIRHSPRGGRVRVAVRAEKAGVVLEVADEGPGVPAADLPRLGQRFWRSPEAVRSPADEGGSGLGLSIVGRIAALHDAGLIYRSPAPDAGKGLLVQVRFPRPQAGPV